MNAAAASQAPAPLTMKDWLAVFSAMLGAFMAILDIQITNSSLADIQGAVGASTEEGSWISTGYLMAEIIVIPLTGWLGGVFGLRRYLSANSLLFILFSIGCAWSHSLNELILFRVGQGFTGGVLIPTAITIVRTRLPRDKQPFGVAIFGLVATFAPAIGPTVGGWLTDNFGWEYIFYLNVPPAILAISLQLYSMPKTPLHLEDLLKGNWWSVLFMSVGLSAMTYVLEEGQRKEWMESELIRNLAVTAVVGLICFFISEFISERPLVNLKLLRLRRVGGATFLMMVVGTVMYGSIYVLPVYLAQVQHYNAEQIGYVIMWSGLPQLIVFPAVPFLMQKIDARIMVATGAILFAISCFMNVSLTHDTGIQQLILPQLLRAIGQPLFIVPVSQLATAGLPPRDTADASSLSSVMRNLGGSIGIAMLSTLIANREQYHFSVLAQRLTENNPVLQERLAQMSGLFLQQGATLASAKYQATALIASQVRREAYVMAFSDAFYALAVFLIASLAIVMVLPKTKLGPGGGGGH
jgi:DHA2 family multidrug resistance protein